MPYQNLKTIVLFRTTVSILKEFYSSDAIWYIMAAKNTTIFRNQAKYNNLNFIRDRNFGSKVLLLLPAWIINTWAYGKKAAHKCLWFGPNIFDLIYRNQMLKESFA
jgi:hypothetical protein